jgi:hypothetical protein
LRSLEVTPRGCQWNAWNAWVMPKESGDEGGGEGLCGCKGERGAG